MSAKQGPLQVFRSNPSLVLLWLGQILSQAGSKMYTIALSWWFLEEIPERAGLWMGILLVLSSLPGILFVKIIGRVVDEKSPKKILQLMDLVAAFICLIPLFLLQHQSVFSTAVCFVAFSLALCQAFLDPTLLRSISFVTKKEDQAVATGLLSSTYSVAGFLGALAGAASMATFGIRGSIYINAFSYMLAFGLTSFAKFIVSRSINKDESIIVSESENNNFRDFLKKNLILKKLLYLFGLINFFATPTLILVPIYTKRILLLQAKDLALFEAALWSGLFLGSLSLSLWKFINMPLKLGAFALSLFGAFLLVPVFKEQYLIYAASLFLAGYFMGVNNVRFLSLFQEKVPLQIQGNFFARLTALSSFTFPIAFFIYGFLADQVQLQYLIASQGLGILVLAMPLWIWSRREVLI